MRILAYVSNLIGTRFALVRTVFIGAIVILFLIALFLYTKEHTYSEAETIASAADFKELQERLEALANDKGAVYAYEILKRAPLPPNTDLHLLGHTVGDRLYAQKGISGIADCTQDFRNACSHSIVIGALNEYGGETALDLIRDACKKAPGGSGAYTMCYHGLGHGVLAYYGYSMQETVELCTKTGTSEYRNREATECTGGAIMELSGGGGHDHDLWEKAREKYLEDPVELCLGPLIPDEAKSICLSYITPEIWRDVGIDLGRPDPALFKDAFMRCESIPQDKQHLRDACYGGFGKEFVPLVLARDVRDITRFKETEGAIVEEWCLSAGVADGRAACIAQVVQSLFWGGENDPQTTLNFCSTVKSEFLKVPCYAELSSVIQAYIRTEKRPALCERIPEAYRVKCSTKD
jgi:hypothetical protein